MRQYNANLDEDSDCFAQTLCFQESINPPRHTASTLVDAMQDTTMYEHVLCYNLVNLLYQR